MNPFSQYIMQTTGGHSMWAIRCYKEIKDQLTKNHQYTRAFKNEI